MGQAICCGVKADSYTSVKKGPEQNIRIWEEGKLCMFKKSFNSVMARNRFKNQIVHIKVAESFFAKEFGEESVKMIRTPFFKLGSGYNCQKLKTLIFLMSRPSPMKSGRITYFDKSIYTIQEILINEEEELRGPVEKTNTRLHFFIELIVSVSIEGITSYYDSLNTRNPIMNSDISNKIPLICEKILADIFDWPGLFKGGCFNYQDLSNILASNPWFLSSGHIRMVADEIKEENY